jgi:hypothetical protein
MSTFIPINFNTASQSVVDLTSSLPPNIAEPINAYIGQAGNSGAITQLQNIAVGTPLQGKIFQQSAFPTKKSVSFYIKGKDGKPFDKVGEGFKPGYFFNMYINPSSMSVSLPPKTINKTRTLGGWNVQHWFPETGSLSFEGIIGNMLERFNSNLKDSDAWRGFKKLMDIYDKNGLPYKGLDSNDRKLAQLNFHPSAVCVYDGVQYDGYFEKLDYVEAEDMPHTIKYNFQFTYLQTMDTKDIETLTQGFAIDSSVYNTIGRTSAEGIESVVQKAGFSFNAKDVVL